ncbi:hypothetical protein ACOSP7_006016 [Xanthoceras sorbifolium]|uniref:Thiol methyltransferase 2 n=1 Tax=Xanthoceras sorbifolium TaxID=99658 RepID=A0ABQ8I840_9ROSI|nr:hypothetical protein JRO89_XS03G0001200 [Xanthoceras sorbifolium]
MRAAWGGLLSKTILFSAPFPPPSTLVAVVGVLGTRSLGIRATKPKMEKKNGLEREAVRKKENVINSNPKVNRIQQLMNGHSHGGWEKCWDQGLTPWDLGQATPIILHLHQSRALPKGRALVPGCGTGYDVVAIASPERHVVGLEISDTAIQKAKELSSSLPNANYVTFLKADFFTWLPTELFDLIFDYTFFCAIEPDMRLAWAQKMRDFLKPNGELITLMFPISDHIDGPPYKVSVSDYEEVLHPMGFQATSIVDNELAVGPRRGREKLGRWKRSSVIQSLL